MADSIPPYPLFMQKMCPRAAFRRLGLRADTLWIHKDAVFCGASKICVDNALTPKGLDLARQLLPGYTATLRQKHEAALWLANAASEVRRCQASAVEAAVAAVEPTMTPEAFKPVGVALRSLLKHPPGPKRVAAVARAVDLVRPGALRAGRDDAPWVAALRRGVL